MSDIFYETSMCIVYIPLMEWRRGGIYTLSMVL